MSMAGPTQPEFVMVSGVRLHCFYMKLHFYSKHYVFEIGHILVHACLNLYTKIIAPRNTLLSEAGFKPLIGNHNTSGQILRGKHKVIKWRNQSAP